MFNQILSISQGNQNIQLDVFLIETSQRIQMKALFNLAIILTGLAINGQLYSQNALDIDQVAWEHKTQGLNNHTEVGYLFNTEREDFQRRLSLRHSLGYMIRPILIPGIGAGYDQYDEQSLLPLYVELRGDLISGQKYSPYYFGQFGTAISTTEDEVLDFSNETFAYEGGAYYQLGLGIKVRTVHNMDWTFSISYSNQDYKTTRTFDDPEGPGRLTTEMNQTSSRFAARIGFVF